MQQDNHKHSCQFREQVLSVSLSTELIQLELERDFESIVLNVTITAMCLFSERLIGVILVIKT